MCKMTCRMMTWATIMMLGVGLTPRAEAVLATGGTVTNYIQNGTNWTAHIFTTVGTTNLIVSGGGNVDVLIVAGGGGGGCAYGGGGGGGGVIYTSGFQVVSGSTNTVTVGAGGDGATAQNNANLGKNGTNSVFGTLIAYGGGGGAGYLPQNGPGSPGGSGGGGVFLGVGGARTNGQGNIGGTASTAPNYGGGGGGGAGDQGTNGTTTAGGQGGAGVTHWISGSAVTYAGGGGGGTYQGGPGGTGGAGGGGKGASGVANSPGLPGTNGLGGGGGGSSYLNTSLGNPGGNGGSGIVIVRYIQGDPNAPTIQNQPVTAVTPNSATFNGLLSSTGASACAVCVYWGADTNAWANTNWFNGGAANPAWTDNTAFSTNISLSPNTTYYYTYGASNATTNVVASVPVLLITSEVTLQATDATASWAAGDTGAVVIARGPDVTNAAMVVNYTIGGTAVNGTDYSPIASSVTLQAGQSNATVTISPIVAGTPGGSKTVTLTLASGGYAIGTPSNDTVTIQRQDRTLYVATNGTHDALNSFNTWAGAATNIHDAVAIASAYDVVMVSNGVYRTTNTLVVSNAVLLLSVSSDPADVTLWPTGGVFHVMTVTNSGTLVAGFTLRGGGGNNNYTPRALLVRSGSTVSNCTITANTSGSTIELYGLMTHCAITNNGSHSRPVRVYNGGVLQDSRISNNSGTDYGGIVVDIGGTVRRCRIHNNWTAGYGHTVSLSGRLENSLVYGNSLSGNFAAGVAVANAAAVMENCVVYGNTAAGATTGGAGVKRTAGTIRNSIIQGNIGPAPADYSGTINGVVFHSLAPTLTAGAQGNITGDPMFVDPTAAAWNFRLMVGSPCRDSGTNLVSITHDIDETARPLVGGTRGGLFHDMGAYEMDGTTGDFDIGFYGELPLSGVGSLEVVFRANAVGSETNVVWYGWDFDDNGAYDQAGPGLAVVTNTFGIGRHTVSLRASNSVSAAAASTNAAYVSVVGTELYVATNGLHVFPFTNWVNAATNVHDAADAAQDGCTVHIGAGAFPTSKRIALSAGIQLLGAGPEQTTLFRRATAGNFGVLLLEHADAFAAGLTITNGYGNATEAAGIHLTLGTVSNCVVTRSFGAGFWNATRIGGSGARMTHSAIVSNSTYSGGLTVLSGGLIEDSLIGWNYGVDQGGANIAGTGRRLRIIYNRGHGSYGSAGLTLSGILENSLIAGNSHGGTGMGSPGGVSTSGRMINCTVAGNTNAASSLTGSGLRQTGGSITNTIIYGNTGSGGTNYTATGGTIAYSLAPELTVPNAQGNLNGDPLFRNLIQGDCRLMPASPCRNAGWSYSGAAADLDLDRLPRVRQGAVDMGAYEAAPPPGTILLVR